MSLVVRWKSVGGVIMEADVKTIGDGSKKIEELRKACELIGSGFEMHPTLVSPKKKPEAVKKVAKRPTGKKTVSKKKTSKKKS